MKSTRLAALAAFLFLGGLASAQQPAPAAAPGAKALARSWRVKSEASSLSYTLKHKLHEMEGKARPTEGRARLLPDGTLQVAVRANVVDFDSGNANRDAHMKEVVEAHKFPFVEFKGLASGVKVPDSFPAEVPVTLKGQVTFHGQKRPVEVPLKVTFTSASEASAEGSFGISLEAFKIERPSLLMVKVDDNLLLEPRLVLELEGK
jgi:polyisoprenoid-binding protein YceI